MWSGKRGRGQRSRPRHRRSKFNPWLLDFGCDRALRPGDEAEFVRLHQAGVRGHDAHAETVGAAFGRGNTALVNVSAVAVGLAALIQHGRAGLRMSPLSTSPW